MIRTLVSLVFMVISLSFANAEDFCKNPGHIVYKDKPVVFAPDGSRGVGLQVMISGNISPVPDLRPRCLPIPVRYNNFGALKTPSAGPWPGQVAKDAHGHAVFETKTRGMEAWVRWINKRFSSPKSAYQIMSIYAPPTDCVGSVGTPPDCPYGINPTKSYAKRIASALNKGPYDKLDLNSKTCRGRAELYQVFIEIATFEIGSNFCAVRCTIDQDIFEDALDSVAGPVNPGSCADPAEAHEG